jgi:hypothetical protein
MRREYRSSFGRADCLWVNSWVELFQRSVKRVPVANQPQPARLQGDCRIPEAGLVRQAVEKCQLPVNIGNHLRQLGQRRLRPGASHCQGLGLLDSAA